MEAHNTAIANLRSTLRKEEAEKILSPSSAVGELHRLALASKESRRTCQTSADAYPDDPPESDSDARKCMPDLMRVLFESHERRKSLCSGDSGLIIESVGDAINTGFPASSRQLLHLREHPQSANINPSLVEHMAFAN